MNAVSMFLMLPLVVLLSVWCNGVGASRAGVCPESKRRYPGDCRLFYRCVLLPVPSADANRTPGVAHAHVWVPTRCTAGLVFEPSIRKCVLPDLDWDCRNDDQLIPVEQSSNVVTESSPLDQIEDSVTEDEPHLDKIDEYNLVVPHVIEIASGLSRPDAEVNFDEEEDGFVTFGAERVVLKSTTPRPYHSAMTRNPYIPVSDVPGHSASGDHIASQMDRIANLAPSLKAVAHTEASDVIWRHTTPAPSIWRRGVTVTRPSQPSFTITKTAVNPVTVSHTQIPRPGNVNVIITPPVAHISAEPHYQFNLLPGIHLNKFSGGQTPNLNILESSVLKHIVAQNSLNSPSTSDQQQTEQLVSALFNKYLANKSFIKKNGSVGTNFISPELPRPGALSNLNQISGNRRVPVSFRVKPTTAPPTTPCVPGVRFPNATDCRRYYMCNVSGVGVHTYTCPPYTAFDKVRRMCDVGQFARCVNPSDEDYNIDGSSSSSLQLQHEFVKVQLPPEEACDARDKLPDPTSPRRYVLCVKGNNGRWTRHQMTCPGSLIYCPTRNFCSPKTNCY